VAAQTKTDAGLEDLQKQPLKLVMHSSEEVQIFCQVTSSLTSRSAMKKLIQSKREDTKVEAGTGYFKTAWQAR
jgi:hypothetical protein